MSGKESAMRSAQPILAVVAGAAVAGLGVVAWLGLRSDVPPITAQMHLTLLGWMSLGICGLCHFMPEPMQRRRLAASLTAAAILGFIAMTGGTAALDATGDRRFVAVAVAGVVLVAAGLSLPLAQLLPAGDRRRLARRVA
jgi:peptidoglycan/LPS O-acetylase OafA/YrhL